MSEPAHQLERVAPPLRPSREHASAERHPSRSGRADLIVAMAAAVLLLTTAGLFIIEGRSTRGQAATVRAETSRLAAAGQRLDAQAADVARVESLIDSAINDLVPPIVLAVTAREVEIGTQRLLFFAFNIATERYNAGDLEGSRNASQTTVTEAVDADAAAIAAQRTELEAVIAALNRLDEAGQATP